MTVIYDSDAAGIKASLRGIDLLLAEGLNIKVLLLPEGDDPDSFAQSHSSSEVEQYLTEHEQDFIAFKTNILMAGIERDPIARAKAIQSIVLSISMIPDEITRTVYIAQCAREMEIEEKVLTLQVAKYIAERREREANDRQRRQNREAAGLPPTDEGLEAAVIPQPTAAAAQGTESVQAPGRAAYLKPYEEELLRYALKYGMVEFCEAAIDDAGNTRPMTVIEYILSELAVDEITFANEPLRRTFEAAADISSAEETAADIEEARRRFSAERQKRITEGIDQIRMSSDEISQIQVKEKALYSDADVEMAAAMEDYRTALISRILLSSPDDDIRRISTEMVSPKHQLSKIHTKFSHVPTERERLVEFVPLAVYNLKNALVECDIRDVNKQMKDAYTEGRADDIIPLMKRCSELNEIKKELAKYLGERILSPGLRR